MKVYCENCKEYTDPQHKGNEIVMNCSKCGKPYPGPRVPIHEVSFEDLKKRYPHAAKYITEAGIRRAEQRTLEAWEFEADLCDRVKKAMDGETCPKCGARVFRIDGNTFVNFNVPFVHGSRIQVGTWPCDPKPRGYKPGPWVFCVICGAKRKEKPKP